MPDSVGKMPPPPLKPSETPQVSPHPTRRSAPQEFYPPNRKLLSTLLEQSRICDERPCSGIESSEMNSGPSASLYKRLGHLTTDKMTRSPAGAVSRDDNVRIDRCDVMDCL